MADPTRSRPRESTADWLRAQIKELIRLDGLEPGDQLPTEHEVAARYGVSRPSVREAFRLLENEGLVSVVHGKGRFISAVGSLRVERPVTKYESTTQMLQRMGYEVTTAVLSVTTSTANELEARALGREPDAPVIRLTRLRFGDGEPLVFSVNTIPRDFLPGPVEHRDWSGSLGKALEAHGRRVVSSVARISAVNLPSDLARRHRLGRLNPWLLVEESCITGTGERVIYANEYHRGSAIAFNVVRRP